MEKVVKEMLKSKISKIFAESFKDPLIYLRLVSGILLLFSFFVPLSKSSSFPKGDFSLTAGALSAAQGTPDLFMGKRIEVLRESPELIFVGGSSLKAVPPLGLATPQILGALIGDYDLNGDQDAVVEYIVEEGDTLGLIAEKFGVSLETVLWANNLSKSSVIKISQKLIIPSVSGVIHYVKAGDTVSEIAAKYKAKTEDVIAFNDLSSEADVYPGDVIVVPGGIMPKVKSSPSYSVPLASSYFICPLGKSCNITQGLHWYNAVDFSNGQCGDPIYAAAGGKVLKVKLTTSHSFSAFGGAGNHLTILHPNGATTFYGHIASSLVEPGQDVSQGQIVALMGGKPHTPGAGKTTGCHVHFGVSGARNPFAK